MPQALMMELYVETEARGLDLEKWLTIFSRRRVSWCRVKVNSTLLNNISSEHTSMLAWSSSTSARTTSLGLLTRFMAFIVMEKV